MIPERLRPILDEVRPLAQRFDEAGHRLYLVGGIVRDLVLGRPLAGGDIDLTTNAHPERTTALVAGWADAVWDQGARFGTVGLKKGDTIWKYGQDVGVAKAMIAKGEHVHVHNIKTKRW